jgi:hypothetical protein
MNTPHWISLKGILRQAYRVASGPSAAYPEYGSIGKQKPNFKARGHSLNVSSQYETLHRPFGLLRAT